MKRSRFPGNCRVGVGWKGHRCLLSSQASWGYLCLASPTVSGLLERGPREGKGFLLASPAAPCAHGTEPSWPVLQSCGPWGE